MNRYLRVAAPLLVLGCAAGGFALLHATKPAPEENEEGPRPVSVFVEPVRRADTRLDVVTHGEVRSGTDVELVAQVAGRVASVSPEFVEGGLIADGAPLVVIEDTDYRLAVQEARTAVAEAELGLEQAKADADVARRQLAGRPGASPLGLHVPQLNQATVRLKSARARLEQAELNLARTRIGLPFPGRVMSTEVDVGQYVTPGTRLGRAFAVDVAEVRLPFTDVQLASLGLPIGYRAEPDEAPRRVTLAAVVGGEQQTWTGRLVRIDAAVDPGTRLVYGLARVAQPYGDGASRSGMPLAVGLYVEATVQGRQVDNAQVIPRDALRAGNQVYVVDADGLLQVRPVTVRHADADSAVIGAGLAQDERVVVSSIRNPIDGMRLNPIRRDEATADAGSPATSRPGT
ncbi:MAG: efflux RND transporter periplasmic adaptor subunit [Tepidisphaera sp.]|nr:efflux RND transporter periplasmic adaptor subunit [Tepidisphaera sp.]